MASLGMRKPKPESRKRVAAWHPWSRTGGRPASSGYGGEVVASVQRFERWCAARREAWARDISKGHERFSRTSAGRLRAGAFCTSSLGALPTFR